ncbi:hypothetical protein [Nannocystis punicea]|uniref:Invertebrate defensins family profile domain-containing protein n=1 Tax=Nannocystis punicea TaxID=2995304 RepID=A0ABY7GWG9_9BACT|nr:hypothetical protein [Nannocystis poenicansa]WAS91331.1 hypothetical protein O0S08_34520 [Nannocystis poenicansa]
MRVEHFVTVIAAVFVLEDARAAPIDAGEQTQRASDVQAAGVEEPAELSVDADQPATDEAPAEDPRFCALDGCEVEHQGCVCSNTGWNGYCGWGPHHPGCLYCRCD